MKIPVNSAVILDPTRLGGDLYAMVATEKEGRPWVTLEWCGADLGLRVSSPTEKLRYIPAARVCEWYPIDGTYGADDAVPGLASTRGPGRPRKTDGPQ